MKLNSKTNNWINWSGSVKCNPREILMPESQQEIISIIQNCMVQKSSIRVVGSGHSFTELVATSGTLVSLDLLKGITSDIKADNVATV